MYVIEALCRHLGRSSAGQRVVVQGFGNVGSVVALALHARGALVVAVCDQTAGLHAREGLDVPAVAEWVAGRGDLLGCPLGAQVAPGEVLEVACELLVPAALEQQITERNAGRLACEVVIEAANGPTTPAADAILAQRGVLVVPDVLANAGGVVVSYFEWVQDQQRFSWEGEQIQKRLRVLMDQAFARVVHAAGHHHVDWRTAALSVAIDRVAHAARLRGIHP